VKAIALQYARSLIREKTVVVLMLMLFGITIASSFIGWSSHHTVIAAYNQTILMFQSSGKLIPPDPFATQPDLSILKNMVIYIPLVGALLAIVIGQIGVMADNVAGTTKLIFSRPIARQDYLAGKLLGISYVLLAIISICLTTSIVSLLIINSHLPSVREMAKLILFYILSFGYLLLFALVGFLAALLTRSQSLALLGALAVWIVISFVIPQFASGVSPIASLNPATAPVDATQSAFFRTTQIVKPVSLGEEFKSVGLKLLDASPAGDRTRTLPQLIPLGVSLIGITYLARRRMNLLTVYDEAFND
jgi:ABC-type transport system involved in multi-copper enzyme maturation permease subunit